MSTLQRNPPRFVPTLTQVVEVASASVEDGQQAPDLEQLMQLVLKQVDARLELRLREAAEVLVEAQLQNLRRTFRAELEPLVRQSVKQAMGALVDQNEMK
jgi:DNA-binding transcriptional regulator YbjK